MINYIYDGSFDGLLTVIAEALPNYSEVDEISTVLTNQPGLFHEIIKVETDPELASCFFKSLAAECSETEIHDIGYCFLSEVRGMEKLIFEFIHLLLTMGLYGAQNFANPCVQKIQRISMKVSHEIQRMHGFVRFRKLANGIFYTPICPDHNIIQLLAPHFKARFADQPWLIHDTKRSSGLYYDLKQCQFLPYLEISTEILSAITPLTAEMPLNNDLFAREEFNYQAIWEEYFKKIAIPERINPKLQRQRMPERYWGYLVEKVN